MGGGIGGKGRLFGGFDHGGWGFAPFFIKRVVLGWLWSGPKDKGKVGFLKWIWFLVLIILRIRLVLWFTRTFFVIF